MTDAELEAKIASLKQTIQSWAEQHNLWYDAGFTTFDERFDDEPGSNPCVLVLWFEGPLFSMINGYGSWDLRDEFDELIDQTEFWYELADHATMIFMAKDDKLVEEYRKYFEFRWICKLVTPDFSEIYQELFEHFVSHPENLHRLDPRGFECLLESIFRNHGYRTELGPGWADGGVDLRLYQKDTIGEIVTLVQAKRYGQNRSIRLEAVAALNAIVDDEHANRGLFVTTSTFLPSARKFAERQSRRIALATSEDISKWCKEITERLEKYSPTSIAEDVLGTLRAGQLTDGLVGKIVHGHPWSLFNEFCLVIKETPTAVLLMKLPKHVVEHDGYRQSGYEAPIFPDDLQPRANNKNNYIRAKKYEQDGALRFWGNRILFTIWDGHPKYFDYRD